MKLEITMRLSSWIRMQQKAYANKLWFVRTPSERVGFCKKPLDIEHLKKHHWDKRRLDHDLRYYDHPTETVHCVPAAIADLLPIKRGTQVTILELLAKIKEIESRD